MVGFTPSQASVYWRTPYIATACARQMVEYVVLDIEPLGPTVGRHALAEAQVGSWRALGCSGVVVWHGAA